MLRYKTAVVDYEGMQECLDAHSAQGWRLFCCNADTWRKVEGGGFGDSAPTGSLPPGVSAVPTDVYSASYYLLVFVRDDDLERGPALAEAAEQMPREQRRRRPF